MIRGSGGVFRALEVPFEVRMGFLLFTSPVSLKKIVYKLIEIVCKLFFLVIFVPNKQDIMKRLTAREEEIMGYFWKKGQKYVTQQLEF